MVDWQCQIEREGETCKLNKQTSILFYIPTPP